MSFFDFCIVTYIILFNFILSSFFFFFTEDVRDKFLVALEKDGKSDSMAHIFFKDHFSITLTRSTTILWLLFIIFGSFWISISSIQNVPNFYIAVAAIILNIILQHTLLLYLMTTGKKIRSGLKNTWIGRFSNAVMLSSVPEKAFWIYLGVVYALNIATIVKIIF